MVPFYSPWSSRDEISLKREESEAYLIIPHTYKTKFKVEEKTRKCPGREIIEEIDSRVILSWFSRAHALSCLWSSLLLKTTVMVV